MRPKTTIEDAGHGAAFTASPTPLLRNTLSAWRTASTAFLVLLVACHHARSTNSGALEPQTAVQQPAGMMPPSQSTPTAPRFLPCIDGPRHLKAIDALEQSGAPVLIMYKDRPSTPEAEAERAIAWCSDDLAALSLMSSNSDVSGVIGMWQQNLDFMKWWLQNRRARNGK
jgi:hypothetical protein